MDFTYNIKAQNAPEDQYFLHKISRKAINHKLKIVFPFDRKKQFESFFFQRVKYEKFHKFIFSISSAYFSKEIVHKVHISNMLIFATKNSLLGVSMKEAFKISLKAL